MLERGMAQETPTALRPYSTKWFVKSLMYKVELPFSCNGNRIVSKAVAIMELA